MDKTIEIAAWLYKNNPEFSNLKTHQAQQLMDGVMTMARLFLMANGQGEAIPGGFYAGGGRVFLQALEGKWYTLPEVEYDFSDDLLHSLKTILRRFSYATPEGLMESIAKAEPFCRYVNGKAPLPVPDEEIPQPFLKSMQAIKQQFKDYDFNYTVIKVQDRNFFGEPGFQLMPGEYDELVRAIKEGLIEPGQLYRLARDKSGGLIAW